MAVKLMVYLDHMEAEEDLRLLDVECLRCGNWSPPAHAPCCHSHMENLCCKCYRRLHFVEVGPCH